MLGKQVKLLVIAVAALVSFAAIQPAFGQVKRATKRKLVLQKDAAPPTPEPVQPPAPLTPAQLPAVAPQISYHNGQLTILAQNSTLGDILRAVKQQTGADIEVPDNANERVVGRLGPGTPRDVLASLLNGSHFDYVMTGSPQDPASLERLLLMPKASSGGEAAPGAQANAAPPQPGGQPQPEPEVQTLDQSSEDVSQDLSDNEQPVDQPAQDEGQQQQDQQQAEQPQPGTFNGQPAIKTPEQLLQELQQRQQQQQQAGAPQGVPPQAAPQGFPIPPGAQPPQQQPQQQPPQ